MRQPYLLHHFGRVLIGQMLKQKDDILLHQGLNYLMEVGAAQQVAYFSERHRFAILGAQRRQNLLFRLRNRVRAAIRYIRRVQLNARLRTKL